jgi:hypothetical protein
MAYETKSDAVLLAEMASHLVIAEEIFTVLDNRRHIRPGTNKPGRQESPVNRSDARTSAV